MASARQHLDEALDVKKKRKKKKKKNFAVNPPTPCLWKAPASTQKTIGKQEN